MHQESSYCIHHQFPCNICSVKNEGHHENMTTDPRYLIDRTMNSELCGSGHASRFDEYEHPYYDHHDPMYYCQDLHDDCHTSYEHDLKNNLLNDINCTQCCLKADHMFSDCCEPLQGPVKSSSVDFGGELSGDIGCRCGAGSPTLGTRDCDESYRTCYDGGDGVYDDSGDIQTPLSPMTASYYEATGCLADEWGPRTPINPPSNSFEQEMDPLPQTPTSPRSASYYEATGCFRDEHGPQTPLGPTSAYHIEQMNQHEEWTPCSPVSPGYTEDVAAAERFSRYSVLGISETPLSPLYDMHQTGLTNPSLNIPVHSAIPSLVFQPEGLVTTPLNQDFVGLLDQHMEVCITRQEIRQHNDKLRWQQWFAYKGNIYTTSGFRDHFITYNAKKAEDNKTNSETAAKDRTPRSTSSIVMKSCRQSKAGKTQTLNKPNTKSMVASHGNCYWLTKKELQQANSRHRKDCHVSDDDDDSETDSQKIGCESAEGADESEDEDDDTWDEEEYKFFWRYDVLSALRKSGLTMAEIESEIGIFRIGTLKDPTQPRWKYWKDVRDDIVALRDDLQRRERKDNHEDHDESEFDSVDQLTEYEVEYLMLLKRWLRRYGEMDPADTRHNLREDGNTHVFMLSLDQDPETLRHWQADLTPLDTELPASGWAWTPIDFPQLPPLGDTHSVFVASLRSQDFAAPFRHDIDGDVAWSELPRDVIKADVMTQNQCDVIAAREARGERIVNDPERMRRRRGKLGRYFTNKYRFTKETMSTFLSWADAMEKGQSAFEKLCSQS